MTPREERATIRLVSLLRELDQVLAEFPNLRHMMDALLHHPRSRKSRHHHLTATATTDSQVVQVRKKRKTGGRTPAKRAAARRRAKAMWAKRKRVK